MKRIIRKQVIGTKQRREKIEEAFKTIDTEETIGVELDYDNACENCGDEMVLDDIEYICVSCGLKGDMIQSSPSSYSNTSAKCYNTMYCSTIGNGPCNSLNDNGNIMYDSIIRKLTKMQARSIKTPIPLEILRQTARDYTELCQTLKIMILNVSDDEKKPQRCNMLLPGLLQQRLHKAGMSRPDTYICQFVGKDKGALTKSVNKLNELMKTTIPSYRVKTTSKIAAYAYQFLARLEIDTTLTDLVVRLIARADLQTDMINFRTCQDETKVVGTIWLLIRQIGIHITHNKINEMCFKISKSTYVRYTDFLDVNRRKFNPIICGNTPLPIRPIPRRFAEQKAGRGRKKLEPLPEEYTSLFMTSASASCV
jgi:hypothetical protein